MLLLRFKIWTSANLTKIRVLTMPAKRVDENLIQLVYYNYYKGKSAKELAEMFNIKLRTTYNIIRLAEKENSLHLNNSGDRPPKLTRPDHSKILKKIEDNPQTTLRLLALDIKNDCHKEVSHETVRKVLKMHKYSLHVARKKPLLSAINTLTDSCVYSRQVQVHYVT